MMCYNNFNCKLQVLSISIFTIWCYCSLFFKYFICWFSN